MLAYVWRVQCDGEMVNLQYRATTIYTESNGSYNRIGEWNI